mgnify:FL=1
MGPEYLAILVAIAVPAAGAGTWVANKILQRHTERIQQSLSYTSSQKRRIDSLEEQINRMPLDYVLKVDFLREIQEMHDNFREINNKLDKLIEKLLAK